MKIKWTKVTWYSKTIALAIFIVWPFIFFFFGALYGAALQSDRDNLHQKSIPIQRSTP
jgi:hypothetical protein